MSESKNLCPTCSNSIRCETWVRGEVHRKETSDLRLEGNDRV